MHSLCRDVICFGCVFLSPVRAPAIALRSRPDDLDSGLLSACGLTARNEVNFTFASSSASTGGGGGGGGGAPDGCGADVTLSDGGGTGGGGGGGTRGVVATAAARVSGLLSPLPSCSTMIDSSLSSALSVFVILTLAAGLLLITLASMFCSFKSSCNAGFLAESTLSFPGLRDVVVTGFVWRCRGGLIDARDAYF